jgi:hypothetical protein
MHRPLRLVVTHACCLEADIFAYLPARKLILGLIALNAGCAHTYQPMTGLHTPVVIDTTAPNLALQAITVHCIATDGMSASNRAKLCQRVGTLFENQGAVVSVVDEEGRREQDGAPSETDLVVELRARRVSVDDHAASWVLYTATLGLLPAVVEVPFAIDVSIRDGGGFLLDEAYLEGRVVAKIGLSAWLTAALDNRSWRRNSPKTSRRAAAEQLSTDLYEQLSQLTFNATTQRQVLQARVSEQGAP